MSYQAPHNEKELLQRIAAGEGQAFGELFDHYHPSIYTIVERITLSSELAEDLCQDCFLKVWLNRAKLPAMENFAGWLRTVASNLTYDALRKRKADVQREENYQKEKQANYSFTPTETLLLEKEYEALIQNGITSLPDRQRQVFILVKQEGRSREEAARIMNITPETVKSNLQAATQKLRAYCIARMGVAGALLLAWALR